MRTVTNYFLANLAVADLLVCIFVLPVTLIANLLYEWPFGPFVCKAAPYLQGISVSASVHTLAAVAVERYLAIFYPKTRKMTYNSAVVIIVCIWAVPAVLFLPWTQVYSERVYLVGRFPYLICSAEWTRPVYREVFVIGVVFVMCYMVPLVVIAGFYAMIGCRVWRRSVRGLRASRARLNIRRSKVKVLRMLFAVFAVFAVSWLPLYAVELRDLYRGRRTSERHLLNALRPVAQWLGAANSCVNPFIYCYYSDNFRRGTTRVLQDIACRKHLNQEDFTRTSANSNNLARSLDNNIYNDVNCCEILCNGPPRVITSQYGTRNINNRGEMVISPDDVYALYNVARCP